MEVAHPLTVVLPIDAADPSRIGHARRQALIMGRTLDFNELKQGQLAIIVTEAAGNIAAHASEGQILLTPWRYNDCCGIDIVAIDKGKGIANIGRAFEDGFSTSGTPGQGLGAMARLTPTLQLYSVAGHGTALFARIQQSTSTPEPADSYALGSVCVPIVGETACGDAWSFHTAPGRSIYILADGLGHGPYAAEASQEAIRIFHEYPHKSPTQILTAGHAALAKTRGAAVSIAEIDHEKGVLNFAGVGNVSGSILHAGKTRTMVTMNGTLGHAIRTLQQFSYPWEKNSSLIMHSDGITTRWSFDQYPGLAARHPALIAAVLYREAARKHDDVTVLVASI
ncbi:MAG: SpoIIE family protein phosphatase [Acidobacteria bacterium]|nr:SpoIIE family protein phosphatase [Acidobacteriota bacterium]